MRRKLTYAALIVALICHSSPAVDDTKEPVKLEGRRSHHPPWAAIPMIGAAGLMTWGVYALGNSTKKSQEYVQLYWGTAAVAAIGIVSYQCYRKKDKEATVSLGINEGKPAALLVYRF